jgi:integrase
LPGAAVREVRDAIVPGLRLTVQRSGAKSWCIRYWLNKHHHKMTLGPYPRLSLAAARITARAALEKVELGVDPRHADTGGETFADAVAAYHKRRTGKLRPTTAQYVKRELEIAEKFWQGRTVASITRKDVIALTDRAEDRGVAARGTMLKVLSAFFKFCEGRDLIAVSPARGVERYAAVKRDRFLDDGEIVTVWKAADKIGGAWGAFTRLLILTGMRRNEAAKLEWAEVGEDAIKLSKERVKTDTPLRVPLTPAMRKVLDALPRNGRYVLCGSHPLYVTRTAEEILGVKLAKHWTWHDLRRSFATGLQRLSIPFEVIEAACNHVVKGVAGVYQQHEFESEIADALEKWSAHIEAVTAVHSN